VSLTVQQSLSESQIRVILDLVARWPDAVDSPPLSDQALIDLRAVSPTVIHVLSGEAPDGYAQLIAGPTENTADIAGEVIAGAIDQHRHLAVVLTGALEHAAGRRLLVWAHGAHSPVHAVVRQFGFTPLRTLLQMRMPLPVQPEDEPEQVARLDEEIVVRAFVPGRDDAAWLAANARAFARHPEQGGWTRDDLRGRIAADWFDADGFLLGEQDGRLLGYHWTKQHDATTGEVYVLGVDPQAQGRGLGRRLLNAGLAYLAARGVNTVLLYVEDSNDTAVALYRKAGFSTFTADTQYVKQGQSVRA
jgi:mycothiol synthase